MSTRARVLSVVVADEHDFFVRGRGLAALADAGKPIPNEKTISFGDPADLLKMLTPARLELVGEVKRTPDSISGIAGRLHRDRAAVKRDVDRLEAMGILCVESRVLPGHGRMKYVSVPATKLRLMAEI